MFEQILLAAAKAFVIGGLICVVGQLLFDVANLTPAHTMSILVSAGALAGVLGLWDKLVDFAGFGAALPIVNFGATLVKGASEGAAKLGFLGIFKGMQEPISTGVTAAVAFGFLCALIFRPKA